MDNNELTLVVFKYCDTTIKSKNVFFNDTSDTILPISMLFYLLQHKGHNILIDTGCGDSESFNCCGFNTDIYCEPVKMLELYGLTPDDITDIIITHAHFDHIGDIHYYKNAQIYIQEDEYKEVRKHQKNDFKHITFNTSVRILDKINIECIGGHSIGSSIVTFQYGEYEYVLGGDECYLNECLTGHIPTGSYYNIEKSRDFINKFSKSNYKVLLYHDPNIVQGKLGYKILIC